jgi:hypothetical protein
MAELRGLRCVSRAEKARYGQDSQSHPHGEHVVMQARLEARLIDLFRHQTLQATPTGAKQAG